MLLKYDIAVNSTKTGLEWLRKWALKAVANGKVSAFLLQANKS